jgi:hypothetical protein
VASRNTGRSRLTQLAQGCVPIRIVERRSGIGEGGQKQSRRTSFLGEKRGGQGGRSGFWGTCSSPRWCDVRPQLVSTSLCPYFWFGTTCNNTSKYWFSRIPRAKFVILPSGQVDLFLFIYILRVKIIPSSEAETLRVALRHHVPLLNEALRLKLPIRPEIISHLEFLKPVQCRRSKVEPTKTPFIGGIVLITSSMIVESRLERWSWCCLDA